MGLQALEGTVWRCGPCGTPAACGVHDLRVTSGVNAISVLLSLCCRVVGPPPGPAAHHHNAQACDAAPPWPLDFTTKMPWTNPSKTAFMARASGAIARLASFMSL